MIIDKRPEIAFLGDSFTWGYEVEFDEMFVNRLRAILPSYQIFNLAHRGYGTDQEFLIFKSWPDKGRLKLVVLMFSENDVADNNSRSRYAKPKPKFQIVDNELVLTGVLVPKIEKWTLSRRVKRAPGSRRDKIRYLIRYYSHFIHDIHFRYNKLLRSFRKSNKMRKGGGKEIDYTLTSRILDELKKEV